MHRDVVAEPGQHPGELAAVRRMSFVMFAGAIFGLVCAILGPDPDPRDHGAFLVVIALSLGAIAMLAARPRATRGLLRVVGFYGLGTTLLCLAVARPTNGVPLYTIWTALIAAYALPRRDFAALLATTIAGLAIVIALWVPPPARLHLWLDSTLTVGFTAVAVRYLRERLDLVLAGLEDVARRLHETARRDPLTGLPNRRAFEEALGRELGRAERSGRPLSVVLLDLDHFKQINDTHGHARGDASLRRFAGVACERLRPGDVLGRIGGEEFALALFDADAAQARAVAEDIAARVRGATEGAPAPLTVSAGVAAYGSGAATPEAVLRAADGALYRAKAAGRRRVAVAGPDIFVGPEVPPARADRSAPEPEPGGDARPVAPELVVARRGDGDHDRLLRHVAIFQCAGGVLAMASSVLLPDPSRLDVVMTVVLCVALAVQGVVLAAVRDLPRGLLAAMPFGAILLVGAAVAVNEPASGTPFFYLWPAVFSAYFFGRRHRRTLLVAIGATYAVVLAFWAPSSLPTSDWTTVMAPVIVAAETVALLRDRIRGLLGELQAKLGQLEEAASHDPLTGVLNRRAFDALFEREVERARQSDLALALVMLDIDHFKHVNDRFGHAAGDEALRLVAGVLREDRRAGDLVGRLGGEEFGVVLLGTGARTAADVADAIAARLDARASGHPATLSMSAGVAELCAELPTTDALLIAADRAMYAAKGAGRARTAVWGPPVVVRPPARAALV